MVVGVQTREGAEADHGSMVVPARPTQCAYVLLRMVWAVGQAKARRQYPGKSGVDAVIAAVEQQGQQGTWPDGITQGDMPCVGFRVQFFGCRFLPA